MPKHKYHELTVDELKTQLKAKKEEFIKLRFTLGATKVINNPGNYRKLKKDIARIMTILTQKQKEVK